MAKVAFDVPATPTFNDALLGGCPAALSHFIDNFLLAGAIAHFDPVYVSCPLHPSLQPSPLTTDSSLVAGVVRLKEILQVADKGVCQIPATAARA